MGRVILFNRPAGDKLQESDDIVAQHQHNFIPNLYKENLTGELWCIAVFFNPMQYESRYKNFDVFYTNLKKQTKNILIVELATQQSDLTLHNSVDHIIQIIDDGILWQKERLLNIALDKLPPQCDKVVWLDSDVIVDNDDWIKNVSHMLNYYKVIQPYQFNVRLPKGLYNVEGLDAESFPLRNGDCARNHGYISAYIHNNTIMNNGKIFGQPGYACAYRRSLLDKHKFYDKCIIGGGDWLIARAVLFDQYKQKTLERYSTLHLCSFFHWSANFSRDIDFSFSFYPDANIYHLFHGKVKDRQYDDRLHELRRQNYDPYTDLVLKDNKCYKLSNKGKRLEKYIISFFKNRNEDI